MILVHASTSLIRAVNRATFYDHYTDKYALLDAMVAGGFHALLHERDVHYDGTCSSAVAALILATCDYLTQTHSGGTACQHQSAFESLVEAATTTAIRRVLMGGMPHGGSMPGPPPEMITTAASWAIYGAVKEWFHRSSRPPADEAVPLVLKLVLPMLETARPVGVSDPTLVARH